MPKSNEESKIVVSKDGPYIVSPGIPLTMEIIEPNEEGLSWDWKTARRFPARVPYELCRCWTSSNKPFCNGSHASIRFRDGLVEFVRLKK